MRRRKVEDPERYKLYLEEKRLYQRKYREAKKRARMENFKSSYDVPKDGRMI